MKKIMMMIGATIGLAALSSSFGAKTPSLEITDDATAIKVIVPSGCIAGMKLELAYDNSIDAASKFLRADRGASRAAWANARTLSESVPAGGAEFTVPLSELGVPADACFRLFASLDGFELLDYVDQDDSDSDHDTGIKDSDCYAIEFGQYSKPWGSDKKYPAIIGTRQPSNYSPGFAVMHNGFVTGGYFMQCVNNRYTYNSLKISASSMNTLVFTNKVLVYNGAKTTKPGSGASTWTTPLGETGMNLFMGRFPEQDAGLKVQSRWYYLRLYGSDDTALLDYLPAKRSSDGAAGFYDLAAGRFVTPTGGGAFGAGTVTNTTFELAIGNLRTFPRLARVPSVAEYGESRSSRFTVEIRPGYGVGSKLYIAHDVEDKGDDIADWSGKSVVCQSIPAAGGTFTVGLGTQGVKPGHVFRAFIADRYTALERVQQDSDDDVIDTGIRDTHCHGLESRYMITGYSNKYATFLGTAQGSNNANCGFRFCLSGNATTPMFGQLTNSKYTWKYFTVTANTAFDFSASGNKVVYNDTEITPQSGSSSWRTSPLGLSGRTIYLGRLPDAGTTGYSCYGWWYRLLLEDEDGNVLLDYVPVQTADGTAGFLDRTSASFVTPTGGGTLVAGDAVGEEVFFCMPVSEPMKYRPRGMVIVVQ